MDEEGLGTEAVELEGDPRGMGRPLAMAYRKALLAAIRDLQPKLDAHLGTRPD